MSQHDMDLVNATGANFRADANLALKALASTSLGTAEPATKFAGQLWLDTSGGGNGVLRMRNPANTAWVVPPVSIAWDGGTVSNPINIVRSTNNHALLKLQKGGSTMGNIVEAYDEAGVIVWRMYLGTQAADDFNLNRYNDTGAFVSTPIAISRATGVVTFSSGIALSGGSGIDMNGGKITELPVPTSATDAASKAYVDAAIAASGGLWQGGTVPNDIIIDKQTDANAILRLAKGGAGQGNIVEAYGATNLVVWRMYLGTPTADDFNLNRYDDSGAILGTVLSISRLSGLATFNGGLAISGGILDMNGAKVTEVGTPTLATDAATKAYVDAAATADDIRLDALEADKAPISSPVFTGNPSAPTRTPATDSTVAIATTAFVQAAIIAAGLGTGVPEAPTDGQMYARKSAAWTPVTSGGGGGSWNGGVVTLPTDFQAAVTVIAPTAAMHATTKTYVDSKAASEAALVLGGTIARDGSRAPTADTPWGSRRITSLAAGVDPTDAVTKGYVDGLASSAIAGAITRNGSQAPTTDISWGGFRLTTLADPSAAQDATNKSYVDGKVAGISTLPEAPTDGQKYARQSAGWEVIIDGAVWNGGTVTGAATFTGTVSVPAPLIDGHAATKLYVDTTAASQASTAAGGAIARDGTRAPTDNTSWGSFRLTNLGDPLNPQDAANKFYVDSVISGAVGITEAPTDGQQYARKNAGWEVVVGGAGGPQDHLEAPGGSSNWFGWNAAGTAWEWRATPGGAYNARVSTTGDASFKTIEGTSLLLANAGGYAATYYSDAAKTLYLQVDAYGTAAVYFFGKTDLAVPGTITLIGPPTNPQHAATKAYVDGLGGSYAPLASPIFTGDPRAPTPTAGDNDTSIATTAFVALAIASAVAGSGFVAKAGDTMTGKLNLPAATTASAGLNIGDGAFPNVPVNGDIWVGSAVGTFHWRSGGVTKNALDTASSQLITGQKQFNTPPIFQAPGALALFKMTPNSGPAAPQDGDVWMTTAGMFVRVNGVSVNLSNGFLPLAGGTLTGNATIQAANPSLILQKAAAADNNTLAGYDTTGLPLWREYLGAATNNDFRLNRYDAAGAFLSSPIVINWSTGKTYIQAPVAGSAGLNLIPGVAPTTLGDGDVWTTSAGIFARINGTTRNLLSPTLTDNLEVGSVSSVTSILDIKGADWDLFHAHSYMSSGVSGPDLSLYTHRGATWTQDDYAAAIRWFKGDPSPATTGTEIGSISMNMYNVGAGAEDTQIWFRTMASGALKTQMVLYNNTLQISGGRIQFPATQNPSSNVNVLDDYEEGAFTPVVVGITTAGTGTYTFQGGRYTKIGNKVFFECLVMWSNHTGTGSIRINGLPFTAVVGNWGPPFTITADSLTFSNTLMASVSNGQSYINISTMVTNAAQSSVAMDTTGTISIAGHYTV